MFVECEHCEGTVDGQEIGHYSSPGEDGESYEYYLVRCPKCEAPILVVRDVYPDESVSSERLFPPSRSRANPSLPYIVRNAFSEALSCHHRAKAYTASALLCRKTLEAVCAEHQINEKDLAASIKKMHDTQIIDPRLYDWADTLRLAGNEAAHAVTATISREDSQDMIDFTNALLEYVFSFRDKFEEFKKRRTKSKFGP
jgi:hypothetical protein